MPPQMLTTKNERRSSKGMQQSRSLKTVRSVTRHFFLRSTFPSNICMIIACFISILLCFATEMTKAFLASDVKELERIVAEAKGIGAHAQARIAHKLLNQVLYAND